MHFSSNIFECILAVTFLVFILFSWELLEHTLHWQILIFGTSEEMLTDKEQHKHSAKY